jgi:hypothetical protein
MLLDDLLILCASTQSTCPTFFFETTDKPDAARSCKKLSRQFIRRSPFEDQGTYLEPFIFFVTYEWTQLARTGEAYHEKQI